MRDIRAILERGAAIQRELEKKNKQEARQRVRETAMASFRENPEQFGSQLSHIMRPENFQAFLGFMTGTLPSETSAWSGMRGDAGTKGFSDLSRIGDLWYKYAPKKGEALLPLSPEQKQEFTQFICVLEELYYKGRFSQLTRHDPRRDSTDYLNMMKYDSTVPAKIMFIINRLAKIRERYPEIEPFEPQRLLQFIDETRRYAQEHGYDDDFYLASEHEVKDRVQTQTPAFDMYALKTSLITSTLIGTKLDYPYVNQQLDVLMEQKKDREQKGVILKPKPIRYFADFLNRPVSFNVDYEGSSPRDSYLIGGSNYVHFDPETIPFHAVASMLLRERNSTA